MDDSAITCDEIIDTDAEAKSYHNASQTTKKQKQLQQILMKKV